VSLDPSRGMAMAPWLVNLQWYSGLIYFHSIQRQHPTKLWQPFASIDFQDLVYKTDSWPHLSSSALSVRSFVVKDLRPSANLTAPPFRFPPFFPLACIHPPTPPHTPELLSALACPKQAHPMRTLPRNFPHTQLVRNHSSVFTFVNLCFRDRGIGRREHVHTVLGPLQPFPRRFP